MAYIAKEVIVEHYHLNRALLLHDCSKFLNSHLETTITSKHTYGSVRSTEGCTYGSRNTEAHSSATARGNNRTLLSELEVTATEHLVLTNICYEDSLIVCSLTNLADNLTHQQRSFLRIKSSINNKVILLFCVWLKALNPGLMLCWLYIFRNTCKSFLTVTYKSKIHPYVLVYLRRINIEMDNLCLLSVCLEITCDTVVKTHTNGNKQITLVGHEVWSIVTMHSKHTHIQRMICWCSRKTEKSLSEWNLCLLTKLKKFLVSTTKLYTLSDEHEWLYRIINHLCSPLDCFLTWMMQRLVRTDEINSLRLILELGCLGILCEIKDYRSRTTRLCNIERASHSPRNILRTTNLIVPLRYWLGNAHNVNLLKGICSEHSSSHLSADNDDRCRVDHSISHTSNGVHSTRTRSNDTASNLSAYTSIALSGMNRSLLVTNEYVIKSFLMVIQSIECWHNSTTRITEQRLYALMLQ